MPKDLEEQLKHIQPKRLSESEREYLWMHIEDGILHPRFAWSRFFDGIRMRTKFSSKKTLLVPLLILALLSGSVSTAFAFADDSVPGDLLFPADIASEKFLLVLTFGDAENQLRLQFAEERLDEIRALIAQATSAELALFGTTTATSTDDTVDETATSTTDTESSNTNTATSTNDTTENQSTDDTSTSTDQTNQETQSDDTNDSSAAGEENTNNEESNSSELFNDFDFDVDNVEGALLFALAQLEESKEVFASKGNSNGVLAINSFIGDLNNLAQNHINDLDRVSVAVKDNGKDDVKVQIVASSQKLKTQFSFTEKTNSDGSSTQSIAFKDSDSRSTLNADDDGGLDFNFQFKRSVDANDDTNNEDEDEENEDGDGDEDDDKDDEQKKERNKKKDDTGDDNPGRNKIFMCHKGNTISISKFARFAHLLHGDSLGRCGEENDDKDDDKDTTKPVITDKEVLVGTTTTTITWKTDEKATSKVWFSTSTPVIEKSPTPLLTKNALVENHEIKLSGLQASTTYYFVVISKDEAGNSASAGEMSFTTLAEPDPEPPTDTTPPEISNIEAIATTTEAIVSWDTNEDADSTVYFSDASPVDLETATKVMDSTFETDHELILTSLTASTTYFYLVVSSDESGNSATSSEQNFTTLPEPDPEPPADTTAPAISDITVFDTTASTTAISWSTNESADGRIWYSIDDPVVAGPLTPMVEHLDLRIGHTHFLGGLTASTTYQFIIVSTDEAGNAATSTQESLTTVE